MRRSKLLVCFLAAAPFLTSCGSSSTSNNTHTTGLPFRVLVSQDISTPIATAGLIMINAQKDVRVGKILTASSAGAFFPEKMYLSDNRQITVAMSNLNSTLGIFSNASETGTATLPLPGPSDGVVISPDATTAYAAVPSAPVPESAPGGIVVISPLGQGAAITATVPIPSVRYLLRSGDGSRILAFSDNSDSITIVPPLSIIPGQGQNTPLTVVPGFDRPINGFFSADGSQAWILNCGPECGGAEASVQVLDLIHNTAGAKVAVPGGVTAGLVNNQTLYVTGNPQPPNNTCSGPGALTTAATTCGRLSIIDLPSLTVTSPASGYVIQDGFHTLLSLGPNNQLFLGSRTCTNIVPPAPPATGEQRGCLFIVDLNSLSTGNPHFVVPPQNGDLTGLQPLMTRNLEYVAQGGNFFIIDTTTDQITDGASNTAIIIIGQSIDVKLIDF